MTTPTMTRVRRAFEAYNAGDLPSYVALYADRVTTRTLYADSTKEHTQAETLAQNERFRETFPDHRCDIDTIVADGDLVSVHYLSSATHAPTSKRVTWACSSLYRFEGDAVVEVVILNDTYRLLSELGHIEQRS
jgi:hypothetical protein